MKYVQSEQSALDAAGIQMEIINGLNHQQEFRQMIKNIGARQTEERAHWRMTRFLEAIVNVLEGKAIRPLAETFKDNRHKLTQGQIELCQRIESTVSEASHERP